MNRCADHKALDIRIGRNEKDIQRIWKSINNMTKWVIAGMGSLLLQGAFWALNYFSKA